MTILWHAFKAWTQSQELFSKKQKIFSFTSIVLLSIWRVREKKWNITSNTSVIFELKRVVKRVKTYILSTNFIQ